MDGGGDSAEARVYIIREIYDSEFAQQKFALELDRALIERYDIIAIEPAQLADETARWIRVGNCLHKTAVVTGLGAIVAGVLYGDRPATYVPMGVFALLSTCLYTIAWQPDPCVKYQVESDKKKINKHLFSAYELPTVIVRKDDTDRKILHCAISVISTVLCAFRIYQAVK